jgi:hypothetical protein
MQWLPFTPRIIPGTHFCSRQSVNHGAIAQVEGLGQLKKIHLIGTPSRDLLDCSLVPQPTTLLQGPPPFYSTTPKYPNNSWRDSSQDIHIDGMVMQGEWLFPRINTQILAFISVANIEHYQTRIEISSNQWISWWFRCVCVCVCMCMRAWMSGVGFMVCGRTDKLQNAVTHLKMLN